LALLAAVCGFIYVLHTRRKKPKEAYFEQLPKAQAAVKQSVAQVVDPVTSEKPELVRPLENPISAAQPIPIQRQVIDTSAVPEAFYKSLTQYIVGALKCLDAQAATDLLEKSGQPEATVLLEVFETYNRIRYAGAMPVTEQTEILERVREALQSFS
jgi:hypothetical protein